MICRGRGTVSALDQPVWRSRARGLVTVGLTLLAALADGCVDPAPYVPEEDGTTAGSDGNTAGVVAPRPQDDALCHDPAAGSMLEVSAPGVLANDESDGSLAAEAVEGQPTALGGMVTISADGGVVYMPPADRWGTDSFTYTALDGDARAEATVQIDLRPGPAALGGVAAGFGGLVIEGQRAGDRAGTRVVGLGDVDGDGVVDLGVAAHLSSHADSASGRSYVVFGQSTAGAIELDAVANGPLGYALDGETARDVAGWSMAAGGDVDGDGRADLLLGAPWVDTSPCMSPDAIEGCTQGRGYVVWGQADSTSRPLSAASNGSVGQAFDGASGQAWAGSSIAGLRDLDGDGRDEVLISAPEQDEALGRVYLIRGTALAGTRPLSSVGTETTAGFVMEGPDQAGMVVAAAGDLDGDGLEDIAIADLEFGNHAGVVYVVFGKLDDDPVDLDTLESTGAGFTILSASVGSRAGTSITRLGDFDGDGRDDLVVSAPGNQDWEYGEDLPKSAAPGRVYVVYGRDGTAPVRLADVERGVGGVLITGEAPGAAGFSVAGLDDFNGDGRPDIAIGAPALGSAGADAGRVYVVFGGGGQTHIDLSEVAQGRGGLALDGVEPYEQLGHSVSNAGDVDGDGLTDLFIGGPGYGGGAPNQLLGVGRAYVMFGVSMPVEGAMCDSAAG